MKWYLVLALALAALVRAPILSAGFVSDDYVLVAGIEGRSPLGNGRYDLWSFYDGEPARQARLVLEGALPWWTEPTAAHAFFRPLSSALLVLVHAVFGRQAAAYYAVVLALSLWNVAVASRIFGRLLPGVASRIALLVFSVHALAADPTRWISALHVLLSAALGFTGWLFYLRSREDGWRPGRLAGVACMAAGLLAGEAGLCPLAFVLGHELTVSRAGKKGRAGAVAPPLAVALGYVVLYRVLHRGARAIDGYLDPGSNPASFVAKLGEHALAEIPRLVTAPSDGGVAALLLAGVLTLAGLAFAFDRPSARAAGGWAAASVLAAMPALMGPTDRALYPATLGASAALGLLVASGWGLLRDGSRALVVRGSAAAGSGVVAVMHVGGGVLANVEGARAMRGISRAEQRAVSALELPDPGGTDIVVLAADDQVTGPWGGVVYALATGSPPRSWQALSLTPLPHSVGRIGDRTLEISLVEGRPMQMHLYRDADSHPMRAGDRVRTPGLEIEVVDVVDGRPARIRVHADRSLDDPSFCFASRAEDKLVRVKLPPVGMAMWIL